MSTPAVTVYINGDSAQLGEELEWTVELVTTGRIFEGPQFGNTPPALRRLIIWKRFIDGAGPIA